VVTFESLIQQKDRLAVVGLGYVGLPLAVAMARHFDVVGYDLKADRIAELRSGWDRTLEVSREEMTKVRLEYTSRPDDLAACRFVIVAVPTPIDGYRIPDLNPLKSASRTVGNQLNKGSCIVYESTVFPGATEDVCIPILEEASGLEFGKDFTVGYSPERINPGDRQHRLETIVKIVAGSDAETTALLSRVYGRVVSAGIHPVSSIKVAEAAKVIENTQRDLNIALMNELSMIFDRMHIDTREVLEAAGTKWNFLPFMPGLVGGHCIGVDPYYLTFKAESLGYHPEMILAGRRINDNMGKYVAERTVKLLIEEGRQVRGSSVAVLGITFKENVPDIRNTQVVDIIHELEAYGIRVRIHDPLADPDESLEYLGIRLEELDALSSVDAVIVAVIHTHYAQMGLERIAGLCANATPLLVDVKGGFDPAEAEEKKIRYWRL